MTEFFTTDAREEEKKKGSARLSRTVSADTKLSTSAAADP